MFASSPTPIVCEKISPCINSFNTPTMTPATGPSEKPAINTKVLEKSIFIKGMAGKSENSKMGK